MARNATYIFTDPVSAVRLMTRRGYRILQDRASGTLFLNSPDRYIHMAPDGEAAALASSYLPCWCADRELAESADREVSR
jgi:hypothetical protein